MKKGGRFDAPLAAALFLAVAATTGTAFLSRLASATAADYLGRAVDQAVGVKTGRGSPTLLRRGSVIARSSTDEKTTAYLVSFGVDGAGLWAALSIDGNSRMVSAKVLAGAAVSPYLSRLADILGTAEDNRSVSPLDYAVAALRNGVMRELAAVRDDGKADTDGR